MTRSDARRGFALVELLIVLTIVSLLIRVALPAGLTPYLPRNFSFRKPHYELDWENIAVSDSASSPPMSGQVLALTVTAAGPRTGLQILRTLGANCTHWSVGDSHTFVVFSTLESPH